MAINGNYITLQRQIADECGDNQALLTPLSDAVGLQSPIQNAIQSAIAKWERETFYFNDFRLEPILASPFQLVAAQEFYGATDYAPIATLACIKSVRVLQGSQNRFTLTERTSNYLNDIAVNDQWRGLPTDYSYDAQQLRIYPIPDVAYPVGLTGTLRLPALVADNDANAWTQDGWDLTKSEAKLILAQEVVYDQQIADNMKLAIYGDPNKPEIRGYLTVLKDETRRRHGNRTRVRPTQF